MLRNLRDKKSSYTHEKHITHSARGGGQGASGQPEVSPLATKTLQDPKVMATKPQRLVRTHHTNQGIATT